ncbi:MAG: SIS domain-containing protein, partial [Acidimicrobiales bacterium]
MDAVGSLAALDEAATLVIAVADALRGVPGVRALVGSPELAHLLRRRLDRLDAELGRIEARLDAGEDGLATTEVEAVNASLVQLKDGLWAIRHDRLSTARAVAELAGAGAGQAAVEAYTSIQIALSAVDRLEVRGRDSAGIHVLVEGHGLDLDAPDVAAILGDRTADPLFASMAVRATGDRLGFVYKAAAEIGELGDNTRRLRAAIIDDALLRRALDAPSARAMVLGHTRWASVGIISEANAHPLHQEEEGREPGPHVVGVLNGDVDNYPALKLREGISVPLEVTTDAKVIPALLSRRLAEGAALVDAFRATVEMLEGSVAIGAASADAPRRLLLALRGSGQALYVGLAEDAFVVASEPYGLVEETPTYLRMDGESGAVPGQMVVLDADAAGSIEGITRVAYDGTPLPVEATEVRTAEITTRDVDRAGFPHYLLKEISQAPQSVRKTLRGRLVPGPGGRAVVVLGDETLPSTVRGRLAGGAITRVAGIGQGTAAVAAQSFANVLRQLLIGTGVTVEATPATELSGFGMTDDMSDTLVVAVSQSGTTTDTNRTVDLVRARGAAVVGIV